MLENRLSYSLLKGLIELQNNTDIVVFNPHSTIELSVEAFERVSFVQNFFPTYSTLKKNGLNVSPLITGEDKVGASIIYCHRSKTATLGLIERALFITNPGGLIIIDGAKTDGINSIFKKIKANFYEVNSFAKFHGKLIWFTTPKDVSKKPNWATTFKTLPSGHFTHPGLFSAEKIDVGSMLLANSLPELSGYVADFGAGWGYLSGKILENSEVKKLDLIEADYNAIIASQRNINDSRVEFLWNDVNTFSGGPYDYVVSNPPFHISRIPDPDIGKEFITRAKKLLKPSGAVFIVANRNLPYEGVMRDNFQIVDQIVAEDGFKVLYGRKPKNSTVQL